MALYKTLYTGKDNVISLTLSDDAGQPFPFITNNISEVILRIGGIDFSSLTDNITFDDLGNITFDIAKTSKAYSLPKNIQLPCSILIKDPVNTKGQFLIKWGDRKNGLFITVR